MAEPEKSTIIFVYNADSGVFNLLSDIAHKMFSPETYACQLCALTHSNFGMKKEWKEYLDTLENPVEFLHADEFKRKYPNISIKLPAIFKKENNILVPVADAGEINKSQSINELKMIINTFVSN